MGSSTLDPSFKHERTLGVAHGCCLGACLACEIDSRAHISKPIHALETLELLWPGTKVIIYKSRGEPFFIKQNLTFGLVLGWLAVLKISVIKLKYATFENIFLWANEIKKENIQKCTL